MKVISIKQPWAWAIINAGKDIENRTWFTKYKGPLLIHTGKTFDIEGYQWIMENKDYLNIKELPAMINMKRGGIIGKVNLIACVKNHPSKWAVADQFHWLLKNPEPIDFIPLRGQLGLFNYEIKSVTL